LSKAQFQAFDCSQFNEIPHFQKMNNHRDLVSWSFYSFIYLLGPSIESKQPQRWLMQKHRTEDASAWHIEACLPISLVAQ
jgi:hypothetical protein